MAKILYRLGRFSARRAIWMVVLWALILGSLGAIALSVKPAPPASMSIPGTEFQTTIDALKKAMPSTSGTSTSVVFSTAHGKPFTAVQEKAVGGLLKQWKATPEIAKTSNPFTTQDKIDKAVRKIAKAKKNIADGRRTISKNVDKLADASDKIADGEKTLNLNAGKLADGRKKLNAGQKKLNAGQKKLETSAAQVTQGLEQVKQGQAQLAAGQTALDQAKTQLDQAQQQLASAQAQLAQDKQSLASEQADADKLAKDKGEDDPAVVAARKQVAADTARVQATADKLSTQAAQLDASANTIDAKQAEITAGLAQLAAAKA
ncbi:MAG: hypothetical protein IT429_04525, partial [Gemmataceae bacterium]|nr:hypothetical protein [Gemmataceae bacterium]